MALFGIGQEVEECLFVEKLQTYRLARVEEIHPHPHKNMYGYTIRYGDNTTGRVAEQILRPRAPKVRECYDIDIWVDYFNDNNKCYCTGQIVAGRLEEESLNRPEQFHVLSPRGESVWVDIPDLRVHIGWVNVKWVYPRKRPWPELRYGEEEVCESDVEAEEDDDEDEDEDENESDETEDEDESDESDEDEDKPNED